MSPSASVTASTVPPSVVREKPMPSRGSAQASASWKYSRVGSTPSGQTRLLTRIACPGSSGTVTLNHQHSTCSPAATSHDGPLPMNGEADGVGRRLDQQNTAGSPNPAGIVSAIVIVPTGTANSTEPRLVIPVSENAPPSETVN